MIGNRKYTHPILTIIISHIIYIRRTILFVLALTFLLVRQQGSITASFQSPDLGINKVPITHCNMKSNDPASCASLDVNSVNLASFAFNLFSLLVTPESTNVLISPFSIASALALALAGTTIDSICQSQIHNVLKIGHHSDIPMISNHLLQSSKTSGIELESANGIWISSSIKTGYINTVEEVHDSKVDTLPKSFGPINEFVSQKTNGMIDNLLQGEIDPLTVAILVNAVYFKGEYYSYIISVNILNNVIYNKEQKMIFFYSKITKHLNYFD